MATMRTNITIRGVRFTVSGKPSTVLRAAARALEQGRREASRKEQRAAPGLVAFARRKEGAS